MTGGGGEEALGLRDGGRVAVRVVGPADATAVAELFGRLSPTSMAMRFGAARGALRPEEVAQMTGAPGSGGLGLVALAGEEPARAIGLARYHRLPADGEAEMAVAVDDGWHGLGVGTGLVEQLITHAARDEIDVLWAIVRPDNRPMITLLRDLGGESELLRARGELIVRIPTAPEPPEPAASARFATAAAASLRPLMAPEAIAVLGASRDPAAPGGAVLRALRRSGFRGPVFAVNPAAATIDGEPAYPSLAELPAAPDLVVVAIPAAGVPDAAREAAAAGARALVVLSSGFAEAGPQGRELEAELAHIARTQGLRVVGPNCLGLAVDAGALRFDATFGPPRPSVPGPGTLGLACQSGGVGIAAMAWCAERGLALSAAVSLGNRADVSSNDLLAWWAADVQTRAVLLHLEGFGNPRRFGRLARMITRQMPVVALKSGRSGAGRRGAASHTAALAAGDAPTDALFELAGVIRADTLSELLEAGQLLASQPLPGGERVAVISNSAGPAILAADACEGVGLEVPRLSEGLQERLRTAGPAVAGTSNPIDLGAGADAAAIGAAGRAVLEADAADAILAIFTPTAGADRQAVAAAVQGLAGTLPVVGCMMGAPAPAPGGAHERRVPWLSTPEAAARALAKARRAVLVAEREPDPPEPPANVDRAAARDALRSAPPGGWLVPEAVEELLAAYGIPTPPWGVALDSEAAQQVSAQIDGTVVVKLRSRRVTHKTDLGGVVLGCRSRSEVARAFGAIQAGAGEDFDGVLVQRQEEAGLDLLVGAMSDPVFGPLVLAAIGGVQAELWGDRALALAPLGPASSDRLWDQLRGARLLEGWRGEAGADRPALAFVTARVGHMIADQPLLAELDINPLRALGPGRGVIALDARARRAEATASA